MKKEELVKAYGYAELLWGTFKRETNNEKAQMQNRLWWDFLKNYDLKLIYASMRELAKESDFCNIAKISKGCQAILNLNNNLLNEDDILKEITNAVDYYHCKENFEKLSPIAKKVVDTPQKLASWAIMDLNTFEAVITSNLRKDIKRHIEHEEKMQSVGSAMLEYVENKNLLENKGE